MSNFRVSHGIRKFFQTNAEPKMKSLDVMTLMGQDTGLAEPTVEMLHEEYLKAVDNLTIDKSRISQTVVEKVSENQRMLVAEMHAKDKEIHELKEQVEEIRLLYEDLFKRNTTVRNFTKDGVLVEILDGFGNRISGPMTSAPH